MEVKVVTRGTHRMRSFAETWSAVAPHLRAMGITRVANVTGLDDIGIPVVMVCRPNARTLAVYQGKGLTLDAARLSGVMEAIEVFHAEEAELEFVRATPLQMSSRAATVDIMRLPLHSPTSFATIELQPTFTWVQGDDLLSGDRRWVPYECVSLGRVRPERAVFASSSSGLGSGNSHNEALSHAICEVVERHSLSIWDGLPDVIRSATRVDLATIEDNACQSLLERCRHAGAAVGVWNVTCEIGIPAFSCYIAQRTPSYARAVGPAAGSGCHPSRDVALARAITEAAQSRLTRIAGARDDLSDGAFAPLRGSRFVKHVLEFIDAGSDRRFDHAPTWDSTDVGADVHWELERLRRAGMREVVSVDLTRAELGIPVVRATIPGLKLRRSRSASEEACG